MTVRMPRRGDFTALVSRMALSLMLWVPTAVKIHPAGECFVGAAVAWRKFALLEQYVCKKSRENKRMETGFSANVFGVA